LTLLREQGHTVQPFTQPELLDRAERIIRSGPVELARTTVAELQDVHFMKGLVPRRDALVTALESKTGKKAEPVAQAARDELEKRLKLATSEPKLAKLKPFQLVSYLQTATSARLSEVSDALIKELTKRAAVTPADARFDALVMATGSAYDSSLLALADTLVSHPTLGVASRYHRARCLERMQDVPGARAELQRVVELDTTGTRFYGQFASQRLRALSGEPDNCQGAGRNIDCNRAEIEQVLARLEDRPLLDRDDALEQLREVAKQHGEAYPWLLRAVDLLQLGELEAVGDELHEAYLAWRWVARRGPLRAGLLAIYRGRSIVQPAPDLATQRARLGLDAASREVLAQAAYALGDVGTAVEFGGARYSERHPEPYAAEVATVARKYKLDPDLLFAVMRVESVYQRRIISHAGAIGLMQIMPRTGRLIADKLGLRDSTAADLLDPRFNLELSGWYLSSLLQRMDGRLPLAIASYNGGPHNVRRWIDEFGDHLPLDAFLERIPFRETKRYVRRVLGYYAEYKAARGTSIDLMSLSLPQDQPSGVAF
jgi:soluble lytic murein transglycosylase-like protein